MGYYLNPKIMTKEAWLEQNGIQAGVNDLRDCFTGPILSDMIPVVLVDNVFFTAAGIAYCPEELDEFLYPDGRSRIYYIVPKKKVLELCPEVGSQF